MFELHGTVIVLIESFVQCYMCGGNFDQMSDSGSFCATDYRVHVNGAFFVDNKCQIFCLRYLFEKLPACQLIGYLHKCDHTDIGLE